MAGEKNIIIDNQPLFYHVIGKGHPMVLLHGFAEDSTVWQQQVDFLKSRCQLIVPDLPGSGLSPAGNFALWSMEYFADAIKAILDQEEIDHCILIGHSMGGYVTLAFAEKYPGSLAGFGLFHSSAYADSEEKKANRRRGIAFIRQHGAEKFLEQSIPNLFSGKTKSEHPDWIEELVKRYAYFLPETLITCYEAMIKRPDRTDVLKETGLPVLFMIGQQDNAVPFEQSMELCHMPSISHIHILAHSGHMGMMEEAALSNHFISEFLQIF